MKFLIRKCDRLYYALLMDGERIIATSTGRWTETETKDDIRMMRGAGSVPVASRRRKKRV